LERLFARVIMTKREFFWLNFYKSRDDFGDINFFCKREVVGNYSELLILSFLNEGEVDYFIEEIDRVLSNGTYPDSADLQSVPINLSK
jgi:hypothetical protein